MQLVNVSQPANSNMFFGYLLSLINIEPVNVDSFNYKNLDLDQDLAPFSPNFGQMGYQSLQSVINMGFSSLWFVYYPFCVLLVYSADKITKRISDKLKYHAKATKFINTVKEKLLINSAIVFVNEAYVFITTSFFLNCLYFKFDTYGNTICSLFTVLLGIISFGFPVFVAVFYSYNIEKTKEVEFNGKWCKLV
jgi:hypothetical protein